MTFLGVYREQIFSPGKVREDAAILNATLLALSRQGYSVYSLSAEALENFLPRPDYALSMAQSPRVLQVLEEWHKRGTRITNSVESVRNCYRKRLLHLLAEAGVPIPPSQLVPLEKVEQIVPSEFSTACWLKRGDVHAIEKGDVVKVTTGEELRGALDHFRSQKIGEVLVQENVEGEVIKFYGVGAGTYFSAFQLSSGEEVSSWMKPLSRMAYQAAEGVGLEIYGGDAILTPEGKMVLIDLNDWPSFSRCCLPAANGIAKYIRHLCEGGYHEWTNG